MFVRTEHQRVTRLTGGFLRRNPVRTLGLMVAVTLLVALIASVAGSPQGARAAGDKPAGPSGDAYQDGNSGGNGGIFWDPAVEEEAPVDEETPAAADVTDPEQTPESEVEGIQGDPNSGRIMVSMRDCYLAVGLTFDELDAGCWNSPEIAFDVFSGMGVFQSGEKGSLNAGGLPGGGYTIREYVPNGYTEPTVFCSHPGTPDSAYYRVATVDGYYEFQLAPGDTVVCHFFNTKRDRIPHNYGELYLYKMVCPEDASFDYYAAGWQELYDRCPLYQSKDVTFSLYSLVDQTNQSRTANDSSEYAWNQVEGGQVAVTETGWSVPGGQVVYCTLFGGSQQIQWTRADALYGTAQFNVTAGKRTACHWFSIPQAAPVAAPVGSTVAISAFVCDGVADDVDPYAAGHDQLLAECQPSAGDAVGFDIAADAAGDAGITAFAVEGGTAWENVATGDVTISGRETEGYGQPVVYCSINNPAMLVFESVYEQVEVAGNAFGYHLDENYSLNCDWFAIPAADGDDAADGADGDEVDADGNDDTEEGPGSVTIVAYACPEGAGVQAGIDEYQESCTETVEGAVFKLDGKSSGNPGEMTTGADGAVTWANREADHYYFYRQEVPEGYRTPAVYCGISTAQDRDSLAFAPYSVGDGWRIDFELAEGESIECVWFDIADDADQSEGSVKADSAEPAATAAPAESGEAVTED